MPTVDMVRADMVVFKHVIALDVDTAPTISTTPPVMLSVVINIKIIASGKDGTRLYISQSSLALSVSFGLCLFRSVSVCLSVGLSLLISVSLCRSVSVCLSVGRSVGLCLSLLVYVCLLVSLSVCLSVCRHLSVC